MNEHASLMACPSVRLPPGGLVLVIPEGPSPARRVAPSAMAISHATKLLPERRSGRRVGVGKRSCQASRIQSSYFRYARGPPAETTSPGSAGATLDIH